MKVEVRARGGKREIGIGEVLSVGSQLEPISPVLMPRTSSNLPFGNGGSGMLVENGLPLMVSLPPNLSLYPGEVVDLRVIIP
jgi:hypothetical protein